jgi:hypothetical protein
MVSDFAHILPRTTGPDGGLRSTQTSRLLLALALITRPPERRKRSFAVASMIAFSSSQLCDALQCLQSSEIQALITMIFFVG